MRRFLIISLLAGVGLSGLAAAHADELQIQDHAPDRYVVVKGDTLWDISGRFLKQPWRWPEIWRLNKDEIKDPHWIYPGDVIVLDRSQQPPRLSVEHPGAAGEGGSALGSGQDGLGADDSARRRLEPGIHASPHLAAIPSVPLRDVQAFMGHPLVVDPGVLETLPRVVAFDGHRSLASTGDDLFVGGALPEGTTLFQVFHPGAALRDPVSGEILAYRADYAGDVRLSEVGEIARLTVLKDAREIAIGDRLMVPESSSQLSFVPSAPTTPVLGRVISMSDDHTLAARHEVVVLSLGSQDGLQPGHILAVYPSGQEVRTNQEVVANLPETRSGLLFVFRTFKRVSYALVVQSQRALNVLDVVRNP